MEEVRERGVGSENGWTVRKKERERGGKCCIQRVCLMIWFGHEGVEEVGGDTSKRFPRSFFPLIQIRFIFGFVFTDQKTSSSHSNSSGLMLGNGLSRLALAIFGSLSDIFVGVSVPG